MSPAADLDLDNPQQPVAIRPRGTWRVAAAVALVGVVAGGAIAAATAAPPPAQPPAVVARVDLAGLELGPTPLARLAVTVRNGGGSPARVGPLWPNGGGLPPGPVTLTDSAGGQLVLGPGQVRLLTATAPLTCPGAGGPYGHSAVVPMPGPLNATLEVVSRGRLVRTVTAASGDLGRPGGACGSAQTQLPRGWQEQSAASSAALAGDRLELTLPRLPGPARHIVAIQADGWFLGSDRLGQDVSAGAVFVRLSRPTPQCWDIGNRPRISTGVELMLLGPTQELTIAYLEVGPVLARWLMAGYTADCPADALVPVSPSG